MKKFNEISNQTKCGNVGAGLQTFNLLIIVFLMLTGAFIAGCQKEDLNSLEKEVHETPLDASIVANPLDTTIAEVTASGSRAIAYPGTSYVSVPNLNSYPAVAASSVSYGGVTYYGGVLQCCITSLSGSTITFKVKRADGLSFAAGSIIKIKKLNAGGTMVSSVTLGVAATTYSLNYTISNTWNIAGTSTTNVNNYDTFVATWYNPVSGLNFYTQSVKRVAVPTGWGINIGTYNTVSVYSNGWGGFSATDYLLDAGYNNSQKYQCVHFVQKYYSLKKGINIGNTNAGNYWNYYTDHNLTTKVNNGAGIPLAGDIICFKKTGTTEYHVGIVAGVVVPGYVRVYEENVGQTYNAATGTYCSAYKDFSYTLIGTSYNINAGALGGSWTTLGWVR